MKTKCPICNINIEEKELNNHECIWEKDVSSSIIKGYILTTKHKK